MTIVSATDRKRVADAITDAERKTSGEIVAVIAEGAFRHLVAPIRRIEVMSPFSPALGDLTIPSARMVVEAAKALSRRSERFLTETSERRKIASFQRRVALAGGRRSILTGDES